MLDALREVHPDIREISTDRIVVADWVRFKCRYGCRVYGKHLCCPPYSPTPEETRRVVGEYDSAVLARFVAKPSPDAMPEHTHHYLRDSASHLHKTVFELERRAFLSGCYKAFGLYAMPCPLCDVCVVEEKLERDEEIALTDSVKCRHKDVMRPSMEACGIDVFETLRNAGYGPEVLRSYSDMVVLFGLVLLY